MMGLAKKASSLIRGGVNRFSRSVIRSEALRKKLVMHYYAKHVALENLGRTASSRDAVELLSWRATMASKVSFSKEVYRGNAFYGIGRVLREYCGAPHSLKACVERGVYFGSYVSNAELERSDLPALVTFGDARFNHIRSVSTVPVCRIGPYIAYARGFLDARHIAETRAELGKTLLVFPSHSIDFVGKRFDVDDFIAEIERVKNQMQVKTVLISLYYRDVLEGAASAYEDAGFVVVTNGYREDENFLDRQKTFIELSDFTMSNSVGTHVGYSIYLGKPHYLYEQTCVQVAATKTDAAEYENDFAESSCVEKSEVLRVFSHYSETITSEQREVCEKYWGFSHVLQKEEMRALFDACERAFESSPSDRQRALARTVMKSEDGSMVKSLIECVCV